VVCFIFACFFVFWVFSNYHEFSFVWEEDELKDVPIGRSVQYDYSGYTDFIKKNVEYQSKVSWESVQNQIELAGDYLKEHPEGKVSDNLKETLIEELKIGFLLDDTKRSNLEVSFVSRTNFDEYFEEELMFNDSQVGSFSTLLLIPKGIKVSHPAIIGLHGHGDSAKVFKNHYLGEDLVEEGFVVMIPNFRAMDCREREHNISKELYLNGFTLMGLRVYEVSLIIDYLQSMPFVKEDKIGLIGHSGGSSTGHLVVRTNQDIKAFVFDYYPPLLNSCEGLSDETLPSLAYYNPQINDVSSLEIPFREFLYGYPNKKDRREAIDFFKETFS